jgi:hypothetical protein
MLEYLVLITAIVGAFLGMQGYIKRGISGRWRAAGDAFAHGRQYQVGVGTPATVITGNAIAPQLIRRSANPNDLIQISMIMMGHPGSDFDQNSPIRLTLGGILAQNQVFFSNGINTRIIAVFRRGDIMNSIPGYGQFNTTITGRMNAPNTTFSGNTSFWITRFTGS